MEAKRDKGMTWCTPVVIKVGDHDEVIFAGSGTVRGYDPATGNELWKLQGPTSEVVPTIVVGTELAYSASGRNGPTIAFRLGEKGDITASSTVWKSVRNGPHVPSPSLLKTNYSLLMIWVFQRALMQPRVNCFGLKGFLINSLLLPSRRRVYLCEWRIGQDLCA